MDATQFRTVVAQTARGDRDIAARAIEAVLTTLRETVRTESFDVTVQLPDEYWNLVAPDA
jgi:uncharacterized protein (DUF2267 family)